MTPQKSATPTPFRARIVTILAAAICFVCDGLAVMPPNPPPTRNFDKRRDSAPGLQISAERQRAESELLARLPTTRVDYDAVTGTPAWVSRRGFLSKTTDEEVQRTGSLGLSGDDRHRAIKAFLLENAALFGHGPEVLNDARITREFVSQHTGLRTIVWQQQLDDIPVFEGVLIGHVTKSGRLVNISSYFLPDIEAACGMDQVSRVRLEVAPAISSTQAVANALSNVSQTGQDERPFLGGGQLHGDAQVELVWLPMSRTSVRLCWCVHFRNRTTAESFQSLVDAASGEVFVRHNCTDSFSATYFRVYTSDSPAPGTPGLLAPSPEQASLVPSTYLQSDAGWIAEGDNHTVGNNVDARLWRNLSSNPSAPVQGSPSRFFNFTADFTADPATYGNASVVNLFYWCNWMHDKLYQLGFDEAADNFQTNNFGRDGTGGDPVHAYAQYGADSANPSYHNNSHFDMPVRSDGSRAEIWMYDWTGPSPYRDGALAAETILHEYTHGLSHRRVGGGVGLSALQSMGMGEGWSDFFALSLLSQASDDLAGTFPFGAYTVYHYKWEDPSGGPDFVFDENYYYGIRRYPYSINMNKNPLTLNDIDIVLADHCASGAPFSPFWLHSGWGSCAGFPAWLPHNMGEVWCVTLWEARKNLIVRYGYAVGNNLALQLVTDGMNLCPPNPTFIQARDALLTADCILTGASNFYELAEAFRKRGMGRDANTSGSSTFPPTAVESFVPFLFGGSWCAE